MWCSSLFDIEDQTICYPSRLNMDMEYFGYKSTAVSMIANASFIARGVHVRSAVIVGKGVGLAHPGVSYEIRYTSCVISCFVCVLFGMRHNIIFLAWPLGLFDLGL